MKIQCDVCEKRQATVICCADEAALCAKCDVEVHAANKLASKHQRIQLHTLSTKLPTCDICQDKAAFIFCVDDRALFCQDCDQSIHSANTLAGNHQRYLATGIRVALASKCTQQPQNNYSDPSNQPPAIAASPPGWAVDDLLEFSELQSTNKKGALELGGEVDWWSDVNFLGDDMPNEALIAAQVPQLPVSQQYTTIQTQSRATKSAQPYKKQRLVIPEDDEEFFIVPDLG
ncbi:uncharacterized protein [Phyllobates terribilis]|uniref:uncharacterized protein n=1 Tax=Phyllobates terribilis TaxID=111132 RepID=UPI003CCA7596